MSVKQWFRRDGARSAGETIGSRAFTLGALVTITALLAVGAALVAFPLKRSRERQMVEAAREQLPSLFAAIEAYRAEHYRFPDRIDDLSSVGYSTPPSIVICRYRHVADVRNFDDHVEVALHHRASATAVSARYPSRGGAVESPAAQACTTDIEAASR